MKNLKIYDDFEDEKKLLKLKSKRNLKVDDISEAYLMIYRKFLNEHTF